MFILGLCVSIPFASDSKAIGISETENCCEVFQDTEDYTRFRTVSGKRTVAGDTLPTNGYLSTDVLLVIYTHSFLDTISLPQIEHIKEGVQQAREFYARNSFFRFNINIVEVVTIDRLLTPDQFEVRPNGNYRFPFYEVDGVHSVRQDLYDLGYTDGQFASVFVFYAWQDGNGFNAPGGAAWPPQPSFLDYTAYISANNPDKSEWLFIHEFHHNIDQMFDASGLSEYPHADRPQDYNYGVFDEGISFNAWMLREWPRDNWALMNPRWGSILTYGDSDDDGLPDSDSGLAIDEVRFGSSISSTDSDFDNLSDLEELTMGTDPNMSDTDGDGVRRQNLSDNFCFKLRDTFWFGKWSETVFLQPS